MPRAIFRRPAAGTTVTRLLVPGQLTCNMDLVANILQKARDDHWRTTMATATSAATSASAPARGHAPRLSGPERRSLLGMGLFIAALHIVGWFSLVALVAPHHYSVGGQVFGIGLGVTAYTLGMRHAFDADHIAAIDNTTRKLMADGQRPTSVGF